MSIRFRAAAVLSCLTVVVPIAGASSAAGHPRHPNGQIAFARYDPTFDDTVLYRINPDGTHERQVLPFPLECPTWSPDGRRLAGCGGPDGSAATIVDVDTGRYRTLPMPDSTLLTYCNVWTPDARRMACDGFSDADPSRNGIYTIRARDGGGLRQIVSNPDGDVAPFAYSPNGRRLAFFEMDADGNTEGMFVARADGRHVHQIAPAGVTCCNGGWSPNGNEIVFARHVTPDVHSSLWIVHANGWGLREIPAEPEYGCGGLNSDPTQAGCFDPRWSPDGRQIVFGSGDDELGRNIWTVRPNGTGLRQVTHGDTSQSNEAPDWGRHPLAH